MKTFPSYTITAALRPLEVSQDDFVEIEGIIAEVAGHGAFQPGANMKVRPAFKKSGRGRKGVGGSPDSVGESLMSGDRKLSPNIEKALSALDAELRAVLEVKFELHRDGDAKSHSTSEVAETLGGTEESIAALEEVALRALYTGAGNRSKGC